MAVNLPITTKIIFEPTSNDAPYVAYCPELDISSCGPTEEKARAMLREAMEIVISEAAKDGTLEKFLESVGYTKSGRHLNLPKVSFESLPITLPENLKSRLQWLA